jgi:hypothetical protein
MEKVQRCPTLMKDAIAQRLFLKFLRLYSSEDSGAFDAAAEQSYRAAEALMKERAKHADR